MADDTRFRSLRIVLVLLVVAIALAALMPRGAAAHA